MHSVDLLEEALSVARRHGFEVRREWLGDTFSGACRVGSKWLLFANESLPAEEQLPQVVAALRDSHVLPPEVDASPQLKRLLSS